MDLNDRVKRKLADGAFLDTGADTATEVRRVRRLQRKAAGTPSPTGGGSVRPASSRINDPLWYWNQGGAFPYKPDTEEGLQKLREFCRFVALAHPVLGPAVEVYSKFPLNGMELDCKDPSVKEWHEEQFFDRLDYENFLVSLGAQYWTDGEAWPLGSFNESMGIWEDDELIRPELCRPVASPFSSEPRFEIQLPDSLRKILTEQRPVHEYQRLREAYPELLRFCGDDDWMPMSNVLLRFVKHGSDPFHERGIPIMYRAVRSVVQEEMLLSAVEAVASRMYTPLVMFKLGASAADLGTNVNWVPTPADIAKFEETLDAAMAADYRVLTYHFAVDVQMVFGRENMPRLDGDFDRIMESQLQVFGLSKTMLSGAEGGQTYAADALNRDLVTQKLRTFQRTIQAFYRDRALVVAEAQEHYDYELKGGRRIPIMEQVLEIDEEGNEVIVEQPKLLIPEIQFASMNMRDDATQRQLLEALADKGVPISNDLRLMNLPIDLAEQRERKAKEQIDDAVEAQRVRQRTYEALRDENLPIPQDLVDDFGPKAHPAPQQDTAEPPVTAETEPRIPTIGIDDPADTSALAPTADELASDPTLSRDPVGQQRGEEGVVVPMPRNRLMDRMTNPSRPPESDEQRAGMPRASVLATLVAEKEMDSPSASDDLPDLPEWSVMVDGPRHVGARRVRTARSITQDDLDYASRKDSPRKVPT